MSSKTVGPEGCAAAWNLTRIAHKSLLEQFERGEGIANASAYKIIEDIIALSPSIVFIEDRQEARSMLRYWAAYLSSTGDHAPDIDIDTPEKRPARISSRASAPAILVAGDDAELRMRAVTALKSLGCTVEAAENRDQLLARLLSPNLQVFAVLLDVTRATGAGMPTLREMRRLKPDLPVLASLDASSPLLKSLSEAPAATAFERVPAGSSAAAAPAYFSADPRMRAIQFMTGLLGCVDSPVLIQGETGCGKEVLAKALHSHSRRANKRFLKLSCAAVPSELIERALFGYERGAFARAFRPRPGLFELAGGGTLLLDEIGGMDCKLQAKLLQVLQDREFRRRGGNESIPVNVRVIATTHRDLEQDVIANTFREDLYHWLNVISLRVPPLRERSDDIVPLAEFLLRKHTPDSDAPPSITHALTKALLAYDWPGNVRELENVVRQYVVFRNPVLIASDLWSKVGARVLERRTAESASPLLQAVKRAMETEAILAALHETRWSHRRAAALLGIDSRTLLRKIQKLGIKERLGGTGSTPVEEV